MPPTTAGAERLRADEIDAPYPGDEQSNGYDSSQDGYQYGIGYPDGVVVKIND